MLKRVLGLGEATFYGVGIILGAGIYALIGKAAGLAGNSLWLSFFIGAIIATFTGLSYAELSSLFPKAASSYIYVKNAFRNKNLAFLTGWFFLFTAIIAASAVSLGFAGYLQSLFKIPLLIAAPFLIILMSLVSYLGIKESSFFNILFTLIEAIGLLIIISIGFLFGNILNLNFFETAKGLEGLLAASALVFFAYLGFENVANLAEETKNPKRNIPLALLLSILITTILYILTAISSVSLVNWKELSISLAPLSLVFSKVFEGKEFILSYIALFATTNTVLISLITASRMMYGMAKDKSLPKLFSKLSKRRTPTYSIIFIGIISIIFALIGEIEIVANATSLLALVIYSLVNLSALILKFKIPLKNYGFKLPLTFKKFSLIPFMGFLSCLFLLLQFSFPEFLIFFLVSLLGLFISFKRF